MTSDSLTWFKTDIQRIMEDLDRICNHYDLKAKKKTIIMRDPDNDEMVVVFTNEKDLKDLIPIIEKYQSETRKI